MDTFSSTAMVIYWSSPHLRKENHQCVFKDLGLEFWSCQAFSIAISSRLGVQAFSVVVSSRLRVGILELPELQRDISKSR
ncbi:hypothetical protein NC652_014296 [Populus alba x Populus x berolinensis]|nr:hypothetical protein NC652_014296 [Populus alba x Populus x berolinensis]